MTTDLLYSEIKKKGTMLCVGLDADYSKIPECIKAGRNVADAVLEFNRRIIDATAPHCVAFKPNLAFYEYLGTEGMAVLDRTVAHIRDNHPGQFIIADAKRGDIGNTARMYAKSLFETFDFDAVTISPYMGSETVTPFLEFPGRFAIVVALSSNPTSFDFQDAAKDGKPLYRVVMEKMMEISTPENMMFVVGATKARMFKEIREFCPDNFFLVPGVGAQGGSAEEVIAGGANSKGGLLINSSRGIIYSSSGEDFAEAAKAAALRTASF
ncbi:MAG: orotidine-5'-phosphate decarboxylase [Bacteroidales bacterium]|nr:orotidine-5'-phosphate decarboxylase [Bacteroidales bacterium]